MEVLRARLNHDGRANSMTDGDSVRLRAAAAELVLTCPGESGAISWTVHQARLAAGFSACQHCPHHPQAQAAGADTGLARSLVTEAGIRGIYLNDLDRYRAGHWSAAFAAHLWDSQPRQGRLEAETRSPARRGPSVVIGFDERPSSPDLIVGVATELRRMGCQVVDLGQVARPAFHFAVHHLAAAGGVFVTGAGCDPAWTGLHFSGPEGLPLLDRDLLRQFEHQARQDVPRPTRVAGAQHPFHATVPYEAGLLKLFHALRPLHVVVGTATRLLPRTLQTVFSRLPCRLSLVRLPVRRRGLADAGDPDVALLAQATRDAGAHLGLVVDDDGERCAFVTDQGGFVTPADLVRLLVLRELHEHSQARVFVEQSLQSAIAPALAGLGRDCHLQTVDSSRLPSVLRETGCGLGLDCQGRTWLGGERPACDAIMTLARVLQALSLSDAPLSEVLGPSTASPGRG